MGVASGVSSSQAKVSRTKIMVPNGSKSLDDALLQTLILSFDVQKVLLVSTDRHFSDAAEFRCGCWILGSGCLDEPCP